MRELDVITDPEAGKFSPDSPLSKLLKPLMRDERDIAFIPLILQITFILLPLGGLLYLPFITGWMWWTIALVYLYLNHYYKSPFGLMSHCAAHRTLFKKEYWILNHYFPWVLGPFFGQSPGTYYSHHIGMHHPENNLEEDISCTMNYQRDSLKDFFIYWANFFFLGLIKLSSYLLRKNRKQLFLSAFLGELIFIAGCVALCFVNWQATVVVFIIPFVISRIVMMVGNWVQHAFVSAADPGNEFKNSITCLNIKFNHRCWNDGYHASHHIKSTMHWTEHPAFFREHQQEFAKNNAVVFDGIDYGTVFLWLMRKRYDLLANHFVNLGNRFSSDEEVIELLKRRTLKIPATRTVLQPVRATAG
jgi:fatty acid desaturase